MVKARPRARNVALAATATAIAATVAGAVVLLGVAGCTSGAGSSAGDGTDEARDALLELLRTPAMSSYTSDLDEFARAAAARTGVGATQTSAFPGTELIGIAADTADDELGTLTFAVRLPTPADDGGFDLGVPDPPDTGPYCFAVRFDHHGKVGEWGTDEGVTALDCPLAPTPVTPPPSSDPVVAPNAREAARAVLADLPSDGSSDARSESSSDARSEGSSHTASGAASDAASGTALDGDEIASRVTAALTPALTSAGEPAPLARVTVTVDGADVGVATGGPDDCVLVARVDGVVRDVVVAPVQLQPGEVGCTASTALHPPDPPH